ncbi:MAG: hypothetical protein WCD53_24320 [Microcoleus sp.]
MALTELQKRKFKVAFDSQDTDGSGVLTQKDFDALRAKMQASFPVTKKLKALLEDQWNALQSNIDSNKDGNVTIEEWYEYLDGIIHDEKKFEDYIQQTADSLLESLDTNKDKTISKAEYIKFSLAVGVKEDDAEAAFEQLDKSGDASISIDELKENIKEFYLTEDENAPGNWLFGKF